MAVWTMVVCLTTPRSGGDEADLFARDGLHRAEVTAIDIPTNVATFDDHWLPFLGGQGPATASRANRTTPGSAR